MKVLQESHCHMKPGPVGADRFARLGLVTCDECAAGELGRFEASGLEKSECGSSHEEPSDICFGFARAELIQIDACDALRSLDQDAASNDELWPLVNQTSRAAAATTPP